MTKRSVVKRKTSIGPDGTVRTGFMSALRIEGQTADGKWETV